MSRLTSERLLRGAVEGMAQDEVESSLFTLIDRKRELEDELYIVTHNINQLSYARNRILRHLTESSNVRDT